MMTGRGLGGVDMQSVMNMQQASGLLRRFSWVSFLAMFSLGAYALTDAGTEIKNLATVTYEDANGNQYSAQSNEAVVVVADVYFAELGRDTLNITGAPGQPISIPHTLKNTGNATDTYTLTFGDAAAGIITGDVSGAALNASNISVFHDTNGNGQADAGEPEISSGGSIELVAGETANLLFNFNVPSTASAGQTLGMELAATAASGITVDDLTSGNGEDAAEATNHDLVTVTANAVLVLTKDSVIDESANQITYTLTVKNNGGQDALDAKIIDAIPEHTTFDQVLSVSGLLAANGDTYQDAGGTPQAIPASAASVTSTDVDEPAGLDLNNNGAAGETAVAGILLTDATLAPNTTVSVTYRVNYDPTVTPANTEVRNTFAVVANTDGSAGDEDPFSSNTTIDVIPQIYGVTADDDDGASGDADDDTAEVASAASGSTVEFVNVISNTGNGDDAFNLSIVNDAGASYVNAPPADDVDSVPAGAQAFPAGTVFTFYDGTGTVVLTDTNNDQLPDTGSIASGASLNIVVKAKLPKGFSGVGPFVATMEVTSANDPSGSPASNFKLEQLGQISSAAVDLANSLASLSGPGDADPLGPSPITTIGDETLNPGSGPINPGSTAIFDLFLENESGAPESFLLSGTVPAGWNLRFIEVGVDTNGDGDLADGGDNTSNAGAEITVTTNLPAGAIYYYQAEVTVSSDTTQALADYAGGDAVNAATGDADGDYPITFTVTASSNSAVNDSKLDAVDVAPVREISVEPNGANQIQPGGSVDYEHFLVNQGNAEETVELSSANSQAADGWSNVTYLFVQGTGYVELSNLSLGVVNVRSPDGSFITITIADGDGDGDPELTLDPGEQVEILMTVFAPNDAAPGDVDIATVSATNTDLTAPASASDNADDVTEVIVGQVRLSKSAQVDTDCDCDSSAGSFAAVPSTQVEPDQCVIWRLEATNESSVIAYNVVISDSVTEYTDFEDSTGFCTDNTAGVSPCVPSLAGSDSGTPPLVMWQVGDLIAGDTARAEFCVRVQ